MMKIKTPSISPFRVREARGLLKVSLEGGGGGRKERVAFFYSSSIEININCAVISRSTQQPAHSVARHCHLCSGLSLFDKRQQLLDRQAHKHNTAKYKSNMH